MRIFFARLLAFFVYKGMDLLNKIDPEQLHLTTNFNSKSAGTAVIHKTLPPAPLDAGANIRYVIGEDGQPAKDKKGRYLIQ